MIIDAHSHGFHYKYLDELLEAGGNWLKDRLERRRPLTEGRPQRGNVEVRVAQLDRNGIDLQVVTPGLDSNLLPGDLYAQLNFARVLNDNMARFMEDSKGRLLTVGTVPIANFEEGGRQEMERAIRTLGLKGISIYTNINGKPLDLPEYEPFWARVAEMDIGVWVHPYASPGESGRSYEADYDLAHNFGYPFETTLMLSRMVFSGMMDRYPDLKIVTHHLGGMIPFLWGRITETCDPSMQMIRMNQVMPRPLFDYFSRFYYDTAIGGSTSALKCAYEVFGADSLIFATDAPNGPGGGEPRLARYPGIIRSLGLSEAENKKIFEDNARRILNMD
ncbi:amidohydrolase family protein [Thermodesulfobacteriota bacterium]